MRSDRAREGRGVSQIIDNDLFLIEYNVSIEREPVPIARGEGVWLYDTAGRRYLDAVSSWWVNLFGHGNARIADAIARQH